MKLFPGICTQCGATLSVDKNNTDMICPYCNTPFIVEKAIQNFNTMYNITNGITPKNVIVQGDEKKEFDIIGGVLTRYNGSSLNIIIPNNVIAIGDEVFKYTKIKSVFMSDNVKAINRSAFMGCNELEEIVLSKNLENIGYSAFWGTTKLKLHLPDSVEYIDNIINFFDGVSIYLSNKLLDKFDTFPVRAKEIYLDGKKLSINDLKTNQILRKKLWHTNIGQELLKIEQQEEQKKKMWKQNKCCQYCGGKFKGFFNITCTQCGRKKDY